VIERSERAIVVWAAAKYCAVMTGYFILRPVREALVLDGDPDTVPVLWIGTFVVMLAITPLWGSLVARWPRRVFVPVVYRIAAAGLLGFAAFAAITDEKSLWLGRVFYIFLSVFNLFVVSVLWSLLADDLGPERARRLYGAIAAGGTVGAVAGSLVTMTIGYDVETWGLLVASAVLLEIAVWCSRRIRLAGHAEREKPIAGNPFSGLSNLVRSPYAIAIAIYVVCISCAATFVYFEQLEIANLEFGGDRDARRAWFAEVDLWTNVGVVAIQTLLTARLLRYVGVAAVLAILPVVQCAGLVALAAVPTITVVAVVQVAGRATTHALIRPARELLFTVVSRDDKYRVKNAIDTLIYRAGDVASAWVRVGLIAVGAGSTMLIGIAAPLTIVWIGAASYLGIAFDRRRKQRVGSAGEDG
jgi:AAA family ATP:ADP antiporter